ncbi:unnamed protein product [Leptidea sinapis]|uniref:Uncharacterized protein n=1 Tax=Leptidea sinapis TaxID=189913 RepID=A0A5E4QJ65_9NEOP|nr:unnamed protein product [Leptidea sinapis]
MLYLVLASFVFTGALCYDAKYDELDVDKILADDALFMSYLNCFLDKGPCTEQHAEDFKNILPEVVKEACGKCSVDQKPKMRKIVNTLFAKKPDLAVEFQKKYDPNHEYEAEFTAFLLAAN